MGANVVRGRVVAFVVMGWLSAGCDGNDSTAKNEEVSPVNPGDGDGDALPPGDGDGDRDEEPREPPFNGAPGDGEVIVDSGPIGDDEPAIYDAGYPEEDPGYQPDAAVEVDSGSGEVDNSGDGDQDEDNDGGVPVGDGDGDVDGGVSGDGDQGDGDGDAVCVVPEQFEHWTGGRTITRAGLNECLANCGDDPNCQIDDNCPGIADYRVCWAVEMQACTGSAAGYCRPQTEALDCCFESQCSGDGDCRDEKCAGETQALAECWALDEMCAATASSACIKH